MLLSRENKMDVDAVKKWFEDRRLLNKPSKLSKFTETVWRFTFYLIIWVYGVVVLWNKPWLWETSQFWVNFPRHKLTSDIYWYYLIELGFYYALLGSQFADTKRKDFWQMFVHHVVTITLLTFSYVCNFTRVGSVILLIHDSADFWIELVKYGLYTGNEVVTNIAFLFVVIVWLLTRLIIFPFRVIYSTYIEGPLIANDYHFPAYYIFNILLCMLQVMHVIWFYYICRMAYSGLVKGNIDKDDRSESDFSEPEKKEDAKKK